MGFNNFCSYLYSNQIRGDNISSLGGKTLGVDISSWLHTLIIIIADTQICKKFLSNSTNITGRLH
jgi:hypothetical protein